MDLKIGKSVGACRLGRPMADAPRVQQSRRPRFRRAADAPAFRLTDGDLTILELLARHRFLRSTHIAALVGRSLDRVNDRLLRLFHAGYLDRPRAQLDYYPTSGSTPLIYALTDQGARLLIEHHRANFSHFEWSRKNREAGRSFIEHQIEIMDFYVSMQLAAGGRGDVRLIYPDEMARSIPHQSFTERNPFSFSVRLQHQGGEHEIGIVPDLVFGLMFADGSRRCFMVEIDRGTMPVIRSDIRQTSFERKMRSYLAAYAARQHERHFGWKTFRVLTVTTEESRLRSMQEASRQLDVPSSPGAPLFFFAARADLQGVDLLKHEWQDGSGRSVRLV